MQHRASRTSFVATGLETLSVSVPRLSPARLPSSAATERLSERMRVVDCTRVQMMGTQSMLSQAPAALSAFSQPLASLEFIEHRSQQSFARLQPFTSVRLPPMNFESDLYTSELSSRPDASVQLRTPPNAVRRSHPPSASSRAPRLSLV